MFQVGQLVCKDITGRVIIANESFLKNRHAVAVKVGWAKGATRAFMRAVRTQPSAGLPEAPPEMPTLWTLPSDLKVIVAWEIGSSAPRHARAPGNAAPRAPWMAP